MPCNGSEEDKSSRQANTGLFDQYEDAKFAVAQLETAGAPHQDISIVANDKHDEHASGDSRAEAVGGAGGLLAGIGLLATPGLGPVVAAGWLVSTVVGAEVDDAQGSAARSILSGDRTVDLRRNRHAIDARAEGRRARALRSRLILPSADFAVLRIAL